MAKTQILVLIALLLLAPIAIAHVATRAMNEEPTDYDMPRQRLMASIRGYASTIGERDDPRVLQSMRSVQRHLFVPEEARREAYEDYPLPIGEDQTISQPSLVALMTHLLKPRPSDVMLEIGTGSGYQAAILSPLVAKVYSIEIVGSLATEAEERLRRLGYDNVRVRHGDGYLGWPEQAPFDGIIVTAGARDVPQPLVHQLKPGGRMVIPVGSGSSDQRLRLIVKKGDGKLREKFITDVRFVPLTRGPRT